MIGDAQDLRAQALAPPLEARADLAASLLDSLEPEADLGAEAAWIVEAQRRAAELDSGAARAIPWHEVQARLRVALSRAR